VTRRDGLTIHDLQCVFQVDRKRGTLTLTEVAPGVDVEEVRSKTDATFAVAEDLKTME
jgi:3-oxoacid CoA-transferase